MKLYHKIQSVYKRDMSVPGSPFIQGEFTTPVFEMLNNAQWIGAEKVDGTNIRMGCDDEGTFHILGRTNKAELPTFLTDALREITQEWPKEIFEDMTLYGEGCGAKIQTGGHNYFDGHLGFILFDARLTGTGRWLPQAEVAEIAESLNIPCAPLIFQGTLLEAIETIQKRELISELAKDPNHFEGLILRPAEELKDAFGNRIITKIKIRDF